MIVQWQRSRHHGATIFTYTGEVIEDRGDLLQVQLTSYRVGTWEQETNGIMFVHRAEVTVLDEPGAQGSPGVADSV